MKIFLPINSLFLFLLIALSPSSIKAQDCFPDGTAPSAICHLGIQVELGNVLTLHPSDFDNGSSDNCSATDDLLLSFDQAGQNISIDISTFSLGTYATTLFVTDTTGNQSACNSNFTILDCNALSLACNDLITVVLPEPGQTEIITIDDYLEGSWCLSHDYSFTDDLADSVIVVTNDTPSGDQTVTITDLNTQNSCWGTLRIVDCSNDEEPPVAICDDLIHVSLALDGLAVLEASIFDNGSYDLCALGSLQVKRSDEDVLCDFSDGAFGDAVTFCCENIDSLNSVELLVTDQAGNTNICFVEVEVKDNFFCANVKGAVFEDENCTFPGVRGLKNWIVTASDDNGIVAQSITDENGKYFLDLNAGDYTVTAASPQNYWEACVPSYTVSIVDPAIEVILNIGQKPVVDCPLMSIDIERPFLRRCFDNKYVFQYCNDGTSTESDAYAQIEFDVHMGISFSSLPYTVIGDKKIQIELGEVSPGECGTFYIKFGVSCDAAFGQTLCVKALIFPDEICNTNLNWSGASLVASATCEGDSVTLRITNNGLFGMDDVERFYVIEEDIIIFMQNYFLGAGESISRTYPVNGQTYLIASDQEDGHPNSAWIIAGVEACNTTDLDPEDLGFLNNYALNSGDLFGDILCLEVIGSFDPNDKSAMPEGYRSAHKVLPQSKMDYTIRFQNTGSDTAFTVVVTDQIDEKLDLNTLRFGASSHQYKVALRNDRTLVFTFDNIMLPDSNVNEEASNGFFKYAIKASNDAEIGDRIDNEAAIFFDFNEPVITNKVFHTIDTNFIEIRLSTGLLPTSEIKKLEVSPNPVSNRLSFIWEEQSQTELVIYNILGSQVLRTFTQAGINSIDVSSFENGVYMMKLKGEKGTTYYSKFVKN